MDKTNILDMELRKFEKNLIPEEISEAEFNMRKMYETTGDEQVDYSSPLYRFVYLFKYYDIHAQMTRMALKLILNASKRFKLIKSPFHKRQKTETFEPSVFINKLVKSGRVLVTSVAGGAGSDFEGFHLFWLKDLQMSNSDNIFTNFYSCESWEECFQKYMTLLEGCAPSFTNLSENSYFLKKQLSLSDLVIMSRMSVQNLSEEMFKDVLRNVKYESYLLVIDNVDYLNSMIEKISEKEFVLCWHYGSSPFSGGVGYGITLDEDCLEVVSLQYTKYLRHFSDLKLEQCPMNQTQQLEAKQPIYVGFQLWRKSLSNTPKKMDQKGN